MGEQWQGQRVNPEVACNVEQVAPRGAARKARPIKLKSGRAGKLSGEGAQRAAIAVMERMHVVQFGIEAGEAVAELLKIEPALLCRCRQPAHES